VPTYSELYEFLRIDQTDKMSYQEGRYVCINFAADLKRNAALAGYNIGFVSVNYDGPKKGGGHAFNGAVSTSKDTRYVVDRWSDIIMTVKGYKYRFEGEPQRTYPLFVAPPSRNSNIGPVKPSTLDLGSYM